jgi:thiamine pyrophosphokinase
VILCALGGRTDHLLANVFMLAAPGLEGRAMLASGDTEITLVAGERAFAGRPGDTLSLLPLGDAATGIWTEGLRYPLRGETLPRGYARGVSNVFVGETARVTVEGGRLVAVHTRCS